LLGQGQKDPLKEKKRKDTVLQNTHTGEYNTARDYVIVAIAIDFPAVAAPCSSTRRVSEVKIDPYADMQESR
jgi:hypothetical protein